MTDDEVVQKLKEAEKALSPEGRLELLKMMNGSIEKTNSDIEGLLSVLNQGSDNEQLKTLQEKMGIK